MSTPAARVSAVSRTWIAVTLTAALVVTGLDAFLLEQRYGYFSGGFLSVEHIARPVDAIAFALASLIADASIAGLAGAVALLIASRVRLPRTACWLAALAAAVAPLGIADLISYRIAAYVGDILNVGLLFDLTGRRPAEILAVASGHFDSTPLVLAGGGGVVLVGLAWAMHRRMPGPRREPPVPLRLLLPTVVVCALGTTATAAIRHQSSLLDEGLRRKPSAQALGWVVNGLTDVDRDGYGWFDSPRDPAPRDPRVFPYALDIAGNGVDEDGIGGDLPTGALYQEAPPSRAAWPASPDVVLVVLESFRADVVGATRGGVEITPVLNQLASQGVSARHAYSHNGYTSQSRHHIFSGSVGGVRQGTLVDDFKAHGYQVAYFSGQDESFGGPAFDSGFSRADVAYDARSDAARRYSTYTTPGSLAVPFSVVQERIQDFLAHRNSTQPLFLYVNFEDTHFPYSHPGLRPLITSTPIRESDITPERRDALQATYANTAANVDRAIGDVLQMVRQTRGRNPGVIVAADHGESLFDDGVLGHGVALNDVQTRIPLIVANLPLVVDDPIGQAGLRDAINTGLASADVSAAPVLRPRADARVFQYLGNIDRPAQIAFTRPEGRLIFDFRSGRARVDDNDDWRAPDQLTAAQHAAWLQLVQTWERMRLARQQSPTP